MLRLSLRNTRRRIARTRRYGNNSRNQERAEMVRKKKTSVEFESLICLFVCVFVCLLVCWLVGWFVGWMVCLYFLVLLENFSLIIVDIDRHYRWRAANFILTYIRHKWGFFRVSHLLWLGIYVYMVISENPWNSNLIPGVWQWRSHYLFWRHKTVATGIKPRTPQELAVVKTARWRTASIEEKRNMVKREVCLVEEDARMEKAVVMKKQYMNM